MINLLQLVGSDLDEISSEFRRKWLIIAFGFFGILLFLVTRPLWLHLTNPFPIVPLIGPMRYVPAWLDQIVLGITLIGCLCFLDFRCRLQPFWVFISCSLLLVLVNQHRLQPWLVQLMLLAVFAASLPRKDFIPFARLLLISIYVFSALSKFDYQFLHTLGQQFVDTLFSLLGVDASDWAERTRLVLAAGFPIGEMLIGIGLLLPKTRRLAAYLAVFMHIGLLLILGPLGLGHHLGVLCWNLFFIGQIWILYLPTASTPEAVHTPLFDRLTWAHRFAFALICLPLLELVGLYDHWPAWQLYAPRNSRVTMNVLSAAAENLPDDFGEFVSPIPRSPWVRVNLDKMSLDLAWVPIYPQDRFQLGVALAIADRHDLRGALQVRVQSASNRWSGERSDQVLRTRDEIAKATQQFRFNATPKKLDRSSMRPEP